MDTLGDHPGWWLMVRCACGRSTDFPCTLLAERHGSGARLPDLVARMRCGSCGAKPAGADLVERADAASPGFNNGRRGPVGRRRVV